MQHDRNERRNTWTAGASLLIAIVLTAPPPVFAQEQKPPQETYLKPTTA